MPLYVMCGRFIYDPALEVSAVRKKDFHPLTKAEDLLMKLIPQLCHESDGLILQVGLTVVVWFALAASA